MYVEDKVVGVTPGRLNFGPLTAQNRAEKKMRTKPVTFVWVSGARKTMNLLANWQTNERAYHATVTIVRPPAEGYERDVEHAKRVARAQQIAAEAAERRRDAQAADVAASILGLALGGAAAYYEGKNAAYENFNASDSGGSPKPAYSGGGTPKCIGYSGPGGPCSTGPGGGLYTGPGGGAYTGPGGGAYTGPGGGSYSGPGGPCSSGPNSQKFDQWNRPSPYCK